MSDEYIRKKDMSDWLKQYGQDVLHGKYKVSLMYIWKNLTDLPSADVAPVRHGKWIFVHPLSPDDGGAYLCSECEKGDWDIKPSDNFCKFCGAKMDGEREEEE